MGISSDFKNRMRKRWGELALRRRIDFYDARKAPNLYVIDMALLLFGKPASVITGRELVDEVVLQEILWFFNKPHAQIVVLAWDYSRYVTAAKGPEQRRRDAQHRANKRKREAEGKTASEEEPMPENINEGALPLDWYRFLGGDRGRRRRAFEWVEQQLEKVLPRSIPVGKRVLICNRGRVSGFRSAAEDRNAVQNGLAREEDLPANPQELPDMRNTIGEADFTPMFVERYLAHQYEQHAQHDANATPLNMLVRSIDQDGIPMGLLLVAERFGTASRLPNHVYIMLSNRPARPDELSSQKQQQQTYRPFRVDDEDLDEEERKKRAARKPYVPRVRDYFDVNSTWRCMMRYYRKEECSKFRDLQNPMETLCYLMFLAGSDLVARPEPFKNKNPLPDVGAGALWDTYEEYYDSIGPLVEANNRQYYPPERRDDAPYVFKARYEAIWKLVRLAKQLKMKARIKTTGLLLPYDTLQLISLVYVEAKHYPEKHEMWVSINNALYALHYYANGHRGAAIVPSCVERGPDDLPRWGFELINPEGGETTENVRRSKTASGEARYLELANKEFPIYL